MTCFVDDSSVIRWNKSLALLIVDMEKSLEAITKWLRKSGLKVNDEKTELWLFHRKNQPKTRLAVNTIELLSKDSIKYKCARSRI